MTDKIFDRYGREVVQIDEKTFSVEGITVQQNSLAAALSTFNGMAPEGWIDVDQ